jgi:serine/threonine-protein kinase
MTDPSSQPLPTLLKAALGEAYTIEGEIGRGGMGVVYRARDERLQRRVAVKVLPPELAFSREIRERFTREAQTAARLSHPHIVPIHDVGEGQGVVYFVMGLIEGESLAARIRRRGRLPAEEVRRIMRETADALSAAHALSVIHRDIKPDNILLEGTRGRVVVTDFGIAKALSSTNAATLTNAGMAIGTPSYMSPEQAAGERDIDGRSDLYSVGIVAYQMLAGELPFNAPTVAGILMKHITEPAPLLHEKFADVPEDLSLAVARCLEKDPTNRWPTADTLRRALESRNVSGYRPTGLGWKAADRPSTATGRPATGRAPRPLSSTLEQGRSPRPRLPRPPLPPRGPQERDLPQLRGREAREAARQTRRDVRRNRGKKEEILPETGEPLMIRRARAEFARAAVMTGGCFMVNVFAPGLHNPWFLIVPAVMSFGLFRRYAELWQAGYSWRDVLHRPQAPDAIKVPGKQPVKTGLALPAPAPSEFGMQYLKMKQIHSDRAVILSLWGRLGDADREMLPDMIPTVDGLYARATDLAQALNAMDTSLGNEDLARIDDRLADLRTRDASDERDRQIALLERQRQACQDLVSRRGQLIDRFESCALMMQNLRFDLIRLKERGVSAVIDGLSQATQQARAMSRDVDHAIDAAAEIRETM